MSDILLAQSGDLKAFDRLVSDLRQPIFHRALKALKSSDDAEDVTQQALILAFRKISSFKGDSKFSTWLYSIVTNCIRMFIRSRARANAKLASPEYEQYSYDQVTQNIYSFYNQVEARNRLKVVLPVIAKMPDAYRDIFEAAVFSGLSSSEISENKGMNKNSVKTRIFRGRKFVKKTLSEEAFH